jgi:hypothetical protein
VSHSKTDSTEFANPYQLRTPPRHAEVAKPATSPDEPINEKIVSALRFFAELNDGRYPELQVICGDLHSERK